jgi:hypothetical protein
MPAIELLQNKGEVVKILPILKDRWHSDVQVSKGGAVGRVGSGVVDS